MAKNFDDLSLSWTISDSDISFTSETLAIDNWLRYNGRWGGYPSLIWQNSASTDDSTYSIDGLGQEFAWIRGRADLEYFRFKSLSGDGAFTIKYSDGSFKSIRIDTDYNPIVVFGSYNGNHPITKNNGHSNSNPSGNSFFINLDDEIEYITFEGDDPGQYVEILLGFDS